MRATGGRPVTRTDARGGCRQKTRGTVCGTMRSMCGADAGCLAINYQSLCRQKDVSEVLQIERVYKNVEKGEFAKAKDLLKAFGTDDQVSAGI